MGARKNAFMLLVEMGHAFIRFGPTPQGKQPLLSPTTALIQGVRPMPAPRPELSPLAEAMERFLLLVYAGLTGSVTMISCTVLALTRLFFEFKGKQEQQGQSMGTQHCQATGQGCAYQCTLSTAAL